MTSLLKFEITVFFWLSLPVHSESLKRIDYPKQICLAHPLFLMFSLLVKELIFIFFIWFQVNVANSFSTRPKMGSGQLAQRQLAPRQLAPKKTRPKTFCPTFRKQLARYSEDNSPHSKDNSPQLGLTCYNLKIKLNSFRRPVTLAYKLVYIQT